MRVPLSLLRKLVDIPVDVDALAETMNGRIAEVEAVHRFPEAGAIAGVRLLRLEEELDRNEEAVHWRGVLGDGSSVELAVSAAFSLAAGEVLPFVPAGETGPDGERVEARELGGFSSQGMLLSEATLGIGDDSQRPLRVAPEADLNAEVHALLELDDIVLEFDLEPNRPDLFSLVGMARDLSAIYNTPLRLPECYDEALEPLGADALRIRIDAEDKVQRYAALAIHSVTVAPSPQWLQNAVRKLGMRPINQVVDATNLAMMEMGQPMHTFDAKRLTQGEIGLRMARPNEKLTTLDGIERSLTEECLLVTDGDTPIALAGVMGDAHSEILPTTTDILIESASFDMAAVRRCSRRLALRTESSLRFEKGLPASRVVPAARRLAWLLLKHGGPDIRIGGLADAWPSPPPTVTVDFSPCEARDRLGMQVGDEVIRRRFDQLGFEVDENWQVTVPDFRPDIHIQADLNEEVGRIQGYEHVVAQAPDAALVAPRDNPVYRQGFALRAALCGAGLHEVYLGVWVGDEEVEHFGLDVATMLSLANPLASHLRYFRPSALPDLVAAMRLNRRSQEVVQFFEVGKVYCREDGKVSERHHLSGAVSCPGDDPEGQNFYRARDAALDALATLGIHPEIGRPENLPSWTLPHAFHPGRWAALLHEEQVVGIVGELHPTLVAHTDLPEAPATFHVDLEALLSWQPSLQRFQAPPRFPSVEYHLNILAPRERFVRQVLTNIEEAGLEHFHSTELRSVYAGEGVPEDQKRLTVALAFNHPERSLTHDEALLELGRLKPFLATKGLTLEM